MTHDFRKEAEELAAKITDWEVFRKVLVDLVQPYLRTAYERGVEDVSAIAANAYNEGFIQGTRESGPGGYSWKESRAFKSLTALKDQQK